MTGSETPSIKRGDKLLHYIPEDGAWYTITICTVMVPSRSGEKRLEVTFDDYPDDGRIVIATEHLFRMPERI